MANKLPLVNIITVAYNAKDDLEKTIKSIVSQDYPRINYIVIDGGSTDGTTEMVKKYENKINFYLSEKDNGIYDAMNKGIKKTREGYLNFLNAGDEFVSKNTVTSIFKKIGDKYNLVYGKIIVGEITKEKLNNPQGTYDFTRDNLLVHNTAVLCHQAMFIKREATPLYDSSYKIKGDLEWYFKIVDKNPNLSYYRSNVVVINYKGGGISEKRYLRDTYETARLIIKRFGVVRFFKYKYHNLIVERIFREFLRKIKIVTHGKTI